MGLWSSLDQTTLDSQGYQTQRLIIEWPLEDKQ